MMGLRYILVALKSKMVAGFSDFKIYLTIVLDDALTQKKPPGKAGGDGSVAISKQAAPA
jgi:hypothetical protein